LEQNNLAAAHPGKVKQLLKVLNHWEKEVGVDIEIKTKPIN